MSRETTRCTWSGLCERESRAFAAGGKRGREGRRESGRWKGERAGGRVGVGSGEKEQILARRSVMFQYIP